MGITRAGVVLASGIGRQKIALIQGSSRGMGLEYVRQLLQRPNYKVIATCRSPPESVTALQQLKDQHKERFLPVQMDCSSEKSIEAAYRQVKEQTSHLNLLVNVAGLLHNNAGLRPEKTYKQFSQENFIQSISVNAMGPALVMKYFSELLIHAESDGSATAEDPAIIANMSARVSSISGNALGGWMSYRASKSALNQLTKCVAIELANKKRKVACILLHPGTVETDMSVPFQRNVPEGQLFSKERAVTQLIKIIDSVDLSSNGKFFAWDGSEIEW